MPDYSTYTIEDLARDAYFRKSVLYPDAGSTAFWQSWAAARPDRKERYEKARIMVITLHKRFGAELPHETVLFRIEQLTSQLTDQETTGKEEKLPRINYWWRAAAVLLVGLGLIWGQYSRAPETEGYSKDKGKAEGQAGPLMAKVNNTKHNQTLILSDSSIVTLLPGSILHFSERFTGSSRKVTLTGDAFFEVTPQSKPFLVYAGETVTRVLGTRFRVTAFPEEDLVRVSVKSGKVSVHRSREFDPSKTANAESVPGVVLTSDEQVVFNRINHVLEKATLHDPDLVVRNTDSREQVFDDTPVNEVLRELENLYGIEIEFNEKVFTTCHIITSFKEETLIERVNSICQAIDASYEPVGGKIVISGKGCPQMTPAE